MTTARAIHHFLARCLCAIVLLAGAGWAAADPPSRVARLAYVSGEASFSPAGEREWARPVVNRPLVTGDRLWVDRGGRAELQLGIAAIRIGGATSLRLLNLDDRVTQLELTQGTLNLRVRRLDRGQVFEVDTPNLAFSIRRPGSYRVEVDDDGLATMVTVRTGQAEVFGEGRAFVVGERRSYRFYDTGLTDYEYLAPPPVDALDRWASERDRRWDSSPSRRYVSAEVIGYQDLDQYGSWRQVPEYGFAWTPRQVPAGWSPYQEGHWAWVEPWGWTWVDEAPWGFAPSHYGRWAFIDRTWMWVPGPAKARPVYAPALVAFVGGGVPVSGGGGATVAWFPLGPRDVYRPPYTVSREYFVSVNTSNTVVNNTIVTNVYENRSQPNVTYVNRQVPGALVAVLAAVIAQSRPVHREAVRVNMETMARAPVIALAPVAPVQASVVGPAPARARPPERAERRAVVAQTPPPPPPVPFAAKQGALAANPGKPLEAAAVAALKPAPAASAPAPTVNVVKPTQPVAVPPAPPASRGSSAAQAARAARTASAAATAPAPAASAPPAAAAAPPVPRRPASTVPPAAAPRAGQAASAAAAPASAPASREPSGRRGEGERGGRAARGEQPGERGATAPAAGTAAPTASAPAREAPAAAPPRPAPAASQPAAVAPTSRSGEASPAERPRGRDARPTREERPVTPAPAATPPAPAAAPPVPPAPPPAAAPPARGERPTPPVRAERPTPPPAQPKPPAPPAAPAAPAAAPPAPPARAERPTPPVRAERPAPPPAQPTPPAAPAAPAAAPPARPAPPPAPARAEPPARPAAPASADLRGGRRAERADAKARGPQEAASEAGDADRRARRAQEQHKP